MTGQFYKQFAVTIAISTVISAINSLTLSPALAARLLKPHGAAKDAPTRLIDRLFGWVFRPFNRFFATNAERYQNGVCEGAGPSWRGVRGLRRIAGGHRRDVPGGAARLHPGAGQVLHHRRREDAGRLVDRTHRRGAEEDRRHRHEHRGRAERSRVPGPQPAAVQQHAQLRRDLLQPQALQRA